jgi:hypothetical protein
MTRQGGKIADETRPNDRGPNSSKFGGTKESGLKHFTTGDQPLWRGRKNDSSTHVHSTGMCLYRNGLRTLAVYTLYIQISVATV